MAGIMWVFQGVEQLQGPHASLSLGTTFGCGKAGTWTMQSLTHSDRKGGVK